MPAQIQFQPVDWRPEGSLAAVYDAHARNQMDWANQRELENARLVNIIKERDAALAQDEMNSPEYRDWRLRGMMGKDQSSAAAGTYDQAILPGKINVTKAEQQGKLDLQQMENEATKLERIQQVLSQRNPLAVQQAMAMLDDDEDRAQLQEMLMDPAYGHQGVLDFLQSQSEQLRDTLARNATRGARMTEDAKHGNAMDLERLKGRNTLANTRLQHQGTMERLNTEIAAGKYRDKSSLTNSLTMALKTGDFEKASVYFYLLASVEENPDKEKEYLTKSEEMNQRALTKAKTPNAERGRQDRETFGWVTGREPPDDDTIPRTPSGIKYQEVK